MSSLSADILALHSSHPGEPWRDYSNEECGSIKESASSEPADLALDGQEHQTWEGFGGCFNELGWIALSAVEDEEREQILASLFQSRRFPLCRVPIGASDYAAEWYSHNENDGDLAMEKFSIARTSGISCHTSVRHCDTSLPYSSLPRRGVRRPG